MRKFWERPERARAEYLASLKARTAFGRVRARTRSLLFANTLVLAFAALALQSCATNRATAKPSRDAENVVRIENFRLGWYDSIHNPGNIPLIRAAGFDFVMPYIGTAADPPILPYLEKAERAGLSVYLEIPRALAIDPDAGLAAYALAHAQAPALAGWYLYDEPEWKALARPAALERAYASLGGIDPPKPVVLVFMFSAFASWYRNAMDSFWFDFYPVAKGQKEFSAFSGGRYTRKVLRAASEAARLGKPLTLVLQGFGEDPAGKPQFGRRLPTPAETRYMFYASLFARPESIVYWAYYRSDPSWIASSLSPVIGEFRSHFPRGVSYESAESIGLSVGKADLLILRNDEGKAWLLVVSGENESRTISLTFPASSPKHFQLDPYGAVLLPLDT